jgi:hypothetical protein
MKIEIELYDSTQSLGNFTNIAAPKNMPPGSEECIDWFIKAKKGTELHSSANAYGYNPMIKLKGPEEVENYLCS